MSVLGTVVIDPEGQPPYGVGALGSVVLVDPATGQAYGVGIPDAVSGLDPLDPQAELSDVIAAYNDLLSALQGTVE